MEKPPTSRRRQNNMQPVALRMLPAERDALDRAAERETMWRGTLMRRIIVHWLRDHGDLPMPEEL